MIGWNRTPGRADELVAAGAQLATSPADLAARSDIVISCVSDTPDVEAVLFGPQGVIEHLQGKTALVFTTSNTPRDEELARFGDPLENLWKTCIFGFCGVQRFCRRNFEPIILSTHPQRTQWLAEVRRLVAEWFPRSDQP